MSKDCELVDELLQDHAEDAVSALNCTDDPVCLGWAVVHLNAKRLQSSLAIAPERRVGVKDHPEGKSKRSQPQVQDCIKDRG